MAKLYVGTSAFEQKAWGPKFYAGVPTKDHLSHFAKHFKTLEINATFYNLPKVETFLNWKEKTPADFRFSIKLSRNITHFKRLENVDETWANFQKNVTELGPKLGPILVQFPPQFSKNLDRLENFFKLLSKQAPELRYAFEFRHPSWYDQEVFDLFRSQKLQLTFVIADYKIWPLLEENLGQFIYVRMDSAINLPTTAPYTTKGLQEIADHLKIYLKKNLDVYVYFNHDTGGYAIDNAKALLKLLEKKR